MPWVSRIPKVVATAPERLDAGIDRLGLYGQAVARSHARVRTGFMRDNIVWDSDARELRGEADYTIYHELGTRHMSAQPMLTPALLAMEEHAWVELKLVFE